MRDSIAILLAAGSGSRMGGSVTDKILAPLNGKPVFIYSLQTLSQSNRFHKFIIVFRDELQKEKLEAAIKENNFFNLPISFCKGGKERSDSVFNALQRIKEETSSDDFVFIHDCARPFITAQNIDDLFTAISKNKIASLAKPCKNTIKQIIKMTPGSNFCITNLNRKMLWETETPQVSTINLLYSAYKKISDEKISITDDLEALTSFSECAVSLIENKTPNLKITTPEDLLYAEWLISQMKK